MVAVSAWRDSVQDYSDSESDSYSSDPDPGQPATDYTVLLFHGSGSSWTLVRVVCADCGGPLCTDDPAPFGLRFTADGRGLVVASMSRVSMFCVEHGSLMRHLAMGLGCAIEVEECEGGWLVACVESRTIEFLCELEGADDAYSDRPRLDRKGDGDTDIMFSSALALVPGLGLVVREGGVTRRLQFFAPPDSIDMASMSPYRVAWMTGVARALAAKAKNEAGRSTRT
jgi:hypothetical protein